MQLDKDIIETGKGPEEEAVLEIEEAKNTKEAIEYIQITNHSVEESLAVAILELISME